MQQKFGLDLYNYKLFGGTYVKNPKSEIKLIYYAYNGYLTFEGVYLNGKKMEKEKNIIMIK